MHTSRVSASLIDTKRLDSGYYNPEHLETERTLSALGAQPLKQVGTFWAGPFGSELPSSLYLDHGIPLFRVSNVGSMQVLYDGMAHLDPAVHDQLSASEVRPGDLLIVKASVGEKICRIPESMPVANITQHIIAIRPNGKADADYVAAFLFGRYGRSQLVRRSLGSIIQYLGVNDARTVLYPPVDTTAQTYIGHKVRQAEQLLALTSGLGDTIRNDFASLIEGLPPCPRAWRTGSRTLDPYRINPGHYDPVVLKMLLEARDKVNLVDLGTLIDERGISGGATPLGAIYCDSGVFFVRVQNVKPYRLDLSDAAYLSPVQDAEIARSRCRADDIIFSITGYPGTASLVMDDDLPININQHCVRFAVRPPYDAAYIVAAMNSLFVKRQVDRVAIGGTREALDYPSVRSLLIPVLGEETMKEIAQRVRTLNIAARLSQRLVVAAKCLVEALIEGKITEAEMVEAQRGIEGSDFQPDRDLLARLTPDGIDVANTSKLFPHLDSLYTVLSGLPPREVG